MTSPTPIPAFTAGLEGSTEATKTACDWLNLLAADPHGLYADAQTIRRTGDMLCSSKSSFEERRTGGVAATGHVIYRLANALCIGKIQTGVLK